MAGRRGFGRVRKRASGRWQAGYIGPDLATHYGPVTFERRQDAEAFGKLYQDVDPKTIPDEVWEEVRKGESLVTAYGRYENRQLQAEIKRLKEQQTAAEQNNKNREKTLGSVKTGGQTAAKDPFLDAFLSE